MSHTTTPFDRRSLLTAAGAGAAVAAIYPTRANADSTTGLRVKEKLLFVDSAKRQRFLWQSTKPPVYVQGRELPAEARGGPPNGSYFIFNDEDQNEKGGITVSRNGATMGLDYPNVQAITFGTVYQDKDGASQLAMVEMPDPDIPVEELTREDVPLRVLLGTSNVGDGALLFLLDHDGRPRITLHVPDTEGDVPTIRVLDENGGVVAS
ncbi:MAG TPA: hypothetical protein VFZ89_02890, partial [Solirubrobacteraceae bacterium]